MACSTGIAPTAAAASYRLILALATMIAVTNLLAYAQFSVLLPVWVRDRLGAVGRSGSPSERVASRPRSSGGLSSGSINPTLGAVSYERIPPARLARVMGVMKASAWDRPVTAA